MKLFGYKAVLVVVASDTDLMHLFLKKQYSQLLEILKKNVEMSENSPINIYNKRLSKITDLTYRQVAAPA